MLAHSDVSTHPRPGRWSGLARGASWTALIATTVLLVRAEARRDDAPEGVVSYHDIVYRQVDGRRALLDVYVPGGDPPATGRPAIVAIHGGGWRGGSKDSYGRMVARMAKHGYVVVSVGYLLSRPDAPSWPENFEDVREAVRWLRRHAADYQVDPKRIAAMGSSAGGHLASLLGTYPEGDVGVEGLPAESGKVEGTSARVGAVVNFFGPTDLKAILRGGQGAGGPVHLLLGGTPEEVAGRYEAASPVRHVSKDDPPMLLIFGSADRTVPVAQAELMVQALEEAGVRHKSIVIDGAGHGFGFEVKARDLLPEILEFLDQSWDDRP